MTTREFLAASLLTVVTVTVASAVHLHHVLDIVVDDNHIEADRVAREVLALAQSTLAQDSEGEPHARLVANPDLKSLMEAQVTHGKCTVYVAIADAGNEAILSTNGFPQDNHEPATLESLVESGNVRRLSMLYASGTLLEYLLPFSVDDVPFGTIRIGVDTSLIRDVIGRTLVNTVRVAAVGLFLAWLASLLMVGLARRPIRRLSAQIDQLRRGQFEFEITDDLKSSFGQLSVQLLRLGEEMKSERLRLLGEKSSLEQVMDCLRDGVLLLDADDAVVFYNSAFAEVVGQRVEDSSRTPLRELVTDYHPLVKLVNDVRERGSNLEYVWCRLPSDGRFHECAITVHLVPHEIEAIDVDRGGVVAVLQDVESLRALQDLARYGTRMSEIGEATNEVVHEVKNPLQAMKLHLDLLEQNVDSSSESSSEFRKSIEVLRRQTASLDRMVREFMEVLRPAEMSTETLELTDIVSSTVDLLRPVAQTHGATIEIIEPEDPPLLLTVGDRQLLTRVCLNVIKNALESSKTGGRVEIRLSGESHSVMITVADNGAGISAADLENVFLPYYTTKADGSGMGLAIVRGIVYQHGGDVLLESEPGEGTKVMIRLPRTYDSSMEEEGWNNDDEGSREH